MEGGKCGLARLLIIRAYRSASRNRPFQHTLTRTYVHTRTHAHTYPAIYARPHRASSWWWTRGGRLWKVGSKRWWPLKKARKFTLCLLRRYKTFIAQKHLPRAARHLHANARSCPILPPPAFSPRREGYRHSRAVSLFPDAAVRLLGYLVFLPLSSAPCKISLSFFDTDIAWLSRKNVAICLDDDLLLKSFIIVSAYPIMEKLSYVFIMFYVLWIFL